MSETSARTAKIANRTFRLSPRAVELAMRDVMPEPITSHFVVVGNRRYPPKQVIGSVTGLERAFFTSHHALRLLRNLGFVVGRRAQPGGAREKATRQSRVGLEAEATLVDRLRELGGQWVATRGDDVLISATSPQDVVRWLAQHDRKADSMFRVPEDELAASGLAPL